MFRFRLTLHVLCALFTGILLLPGPFEAVLADYPADLDEPLPPRALGHYRYLKAHFESRFDGYGVTDVFVPQFAAVFLSHSAMGFLNVGLSDHERRAEVGPLLDEVLERALSPSVSPYGKSPADIRNLGDHNLYLSHLNLILGCRRKIIGDETHDSLHARISDHLARKSVGSGVGHARSYPGSARFPADQSVTLASLALYDSCHGTSLSGRPIVLWLNVMKGRATDPRTKLHKSSISSSYPNARLPRGCALSWTALYMAQFAPDEARTLYTGYREEFLTDVAGWGGFREYPDGIERSMDADSGLIILGLGMAATGLGVGPARLFGDRKAYASILRTAASVGSPTIPSWRRSFRLSPLLGEAILFHGMTARIWDGEARGGSFEGETPFPTGALLTCAALLAILSFNLRRGITLFRRIRSL